MTDLINTSNRFFMFLTYHSFSSTEEESTIIFLHSIILHFKVVFCSYGESNQIIFNASFNIVIIESSIVEGFKMLT